MKIAHIIGSCGPGGAECFVKTLLLEMKKQGADVSLWVITPQTLINRRNKDQLDFEANYLAELKKVNIPVSFIGKRPQKDWFKCSIALNRLYNQQQPQVIHTHLESVSFHVARSLWTRRVVMVQTIHNTIVRNRTIVRIFLSKVFNHYVAISHKVKNVIMQAGAPERKVSVIFNGVDLSVLSPDTRTMRDSPESIIAIGRLTQQKNHANLIAALYILREHKFQNEQHFPKTYIAGDGNLKSDIIAQISALGLQDDVVLLGTRRDIPELLQKHDLYVMSSDYEGLSISLIEAIASGIPVVATDAGSNNEIIDHNDNGLLVPIKNPDALASAIYHLLSDQVLRVRFSRNGLQKARMFSIHECAGKHLQLYNSLYSR